MLTVDRQWVHENYGERYPTARVFEEKEAFIVDKANDGSKAGSIFFDGASPTFPTLKEGFGEYFRFGGGRNPADDAGLSMVESILQEFFTGVRVVPK